MSIFSLCLLLLITLSTAETTKVFCKFSYDKSNFNDSEIYQCQLEPVDFLSPNITVITAIGDHLPKMTNDDVKELEIISGVWNFFPNGLDLIFENLGMIYIDNVNLTSLSVYDLRPFENLQYLWIREHSIPEFEPELIEFIFNLTQYKVIVKNIFDRKIFSVYEVLRDKISDEKDKVFVDFDDKVYREDLNIIRVNKSVLNVAAEISILKRSLEDLKTENSNLKKSLDDHQSNFQIVTILGFFFLLFINILSCFVDFRSIFFQLNQGLTTLNANDRRHLVREDFSMEHPSENGGHILD